MLKQAKKLLFDQKYQQAIQKYQEYINTNPGTNAVLSTYYNIAEAYNQSHLTDNFKKAAAFYQKIINVDPNFQQGQIYYQQAQSYQQGKMFAESRAAYQQYLSRYPNHPECNFNLGIVHEELGEFDKAILCFQRSYSNKVGYIKAYRAKILILKKQQKFQQIIKTCKAAIKHQPTNFILNYEEGMACLRLNRYNQAASSLKESISLNKKFVRPYIALGEVYLKMGKGQGLQILQSCIQLNKDVIKNAQLKELRYWIGMFKMSEKKYQQASKYFKYVVNIKPVNELAKQKLVECLQEQGHEFFKKKNYSDALQCYNQALQYNNSKISLLNNTGLAFQNINNLNKAEYYYREVLKQDPQNNAALNNLAALEHLRGNSKAAESIFIQITSSNPQNFQAYANKGKQFLSMHRYSQAIKQFKTAEKMSKGDNFNLYNDMAVAYQSLGQYQQALNYANKASKLTEDRSPLILMNRASILMHMNKVNQAHADMDKASKQMKNTDKSNLVKLGINASNLKYIFSQLNHYSYLMGPITTFQQTLKKEIKKHEKLKQNKEALKEINQKIQKATQFAIKRVVHQKNKQDIANQQIDPQRARQDYSRIQQMMNDATQTMNKKIDHQDQQGKELIGQIQLVKRRTADLQYPVFKFIPYSFHLRDKLQQLYDQQEIEMWQYGKQLYWILNGYLKGFLLLQTSVISKKETPDRATFNKILKKLKQIPQLSENMSTIIQFSELISKICGLLVDMDDSQIIQKIYQMICFNYDTQEDLNDEICQVTMLFLQTKAKIYKVQTKTIFSPEGQFLKSLQNSKDVEEWFNYKKEQFMAHMKGFEKSQSILQSQLVVVDIGVIVSILLGMKSKNWTKQNVLKIASQNALCQNKVEQMICDAYKRDNQSLRVSQNSFCSVM